MEGDKNQGRGKRSGEMLLHNVSLSGIADSL